MNWIIDEERITAQEYIEFLKKTDLGLSIPKKDSRKELIPW